MSNARSRTQRWPDDDMAVGEPARGRELSAQRGMALSADHAEPDLAEGPRERSGIAIEIA